MSDLKILNIVSTVAPSEPHFVFESTEHSFVGILSFWVIAQVEDIPTGFKFFKTIPICGELTAETLDEQGYALHWINVEDDMLEGYYASSALEYLNKLRS